MNSRGGESDATARNTGEATLASIALADFARRVFWDLCWFGATIAAIVALLRIVAHDQHLFLIAANSFSAYLYAPALLVFPLAIWQRRTRLAVVCFGLFLCHAVWVWPDYMPLITAADNASLAGDRPVLRIFSGNVHCRNSDPGSILAEIREAEADVVLIQEYSTIWHEALARDGFSQRYPHRVVDIRDDAFGIAIYSKLAFVEQELWFSGRIPTAEVVVQHAGRKVRIINWHPLPPRTLDYVADWRQHYDELFRRLAADDEPALLVGDFNATQHAAQMERLGRAGLRSAHESVGRAFAVTWPNRLGLLPPIRLDHAYYSQHFRCIAIREGTGQGSDHKPLVADFVLIDDDRTNADSSARER